MVENIKIDSSIAEIFKQYAPFYHVTSKRAAREIDVMGLLPTAYPAYQYHGGIANKRDQICFCPKIDLENQKENVKDKYNDGCEVFEIELAVLLSKNIGFDYTFQQVAVLETFPSTEAKLKYALGTMKTICCFEPVPRSQLKHIESKTKEEIAIEELEMAIGAFNHGFYVPAITLGAAAEELFGAVLKAWGKAEGKTVLTRAEIDKGLFDMTKEIHGIRDYMSWRNRIKNELKHHGGENNKEVVKADFRQIALNHISGAITNYKLLINRIPDSPEVVEFCKKEGIT